jgi:2-polyprenyl-6-methoxyphenol hydroxylase-like FAD-dependent oxidoreductase
MATEPAALKPSYDVVIIGARAAGASTAMLLARRGARVLLLEQGARGADTLSTLALMRAGVVQLSRWGLLDGIRASGTPRIEKTTFHYAAAAVEVPIKPRDGVDALYAPRRTVLDPLLADAAAAAGADVAYRVRVVDVTRTAAGRVNGVVVDDAGRERRTIEAPLVVGADGLHSTIAQRVGALPYHTGPHVTAVIYTLVTGLAPDGYHWRYGDRASVGQIPTTGGDVLVFVSIPRERFMRELRFDLESSFYEVLREVSPALETSVRALQPKGPFRGFAGHEGVVRQAWGPGWALVGDAGYFKDPLTAHGITDALRDAELLARAVERGTDGALADYQSVRDELSMGLFWITDEIASFEWSLSRLQALHKAMSEEMAREARYLNALDVIAV